MKIYDKLNKQTQEYLQAPPSERRDVLKKHYLKNRFGASEREQAIDHLSFLIEFTRRLNMLEGKGNILLQIPKPSALRKNDLFVAIEICAESIRENAALKMDADFWQCWTAFEELLERVKSKDGTESFFETAYLLLYLAALIFKRRILNGAIEKEPQIFSMEGYAAVAAKFAHPLFDSAHSSADQLESLTENLKNMVCQH